MACIKGSLVDANTTSMMLEYGETWDGWREIFAYIHHPVSGIPGGIRVQTEALLVSPGEPADRGAEFINESSDLGNHEPHRRLQEKLFVGFPHFCACPQLEVCYALGSSDDLRVALEEVLQEFGG